MFYSPDVYRKCTQYVVQSYEGRNLKELGFPDFIQATLVCSEAIVWMIHHPETGKDGNLIVQCAFLNTALKKVDANYDHIRKVFGAAVACGILALNRDESLPNDPPVRLQLIDSLRRIRNQPKEIWMVEMASWIVSLQPPTKSWNYRQINLLCQEAIAIHEALKEACPFLADRLLVKIKDYSVYLK